MMLSSSFLDSRDFTVHRGYPSVNWRISSYHSVSWHSEYTIHTRQWAFRYGERERERQRPRDRQILPYSISYDIKHHNFPIRLYTVTLYVPFSAIPCINDEDKSVSDAMGFSYDDVVDENFIVKSGQVNSHILFQLFYGHALF